MNIDIVYIVIVIIVILLSMTLHEAMHAFVGYWLGDDTAKVQGRLTLNPIKHIDPFLTIILPVILAIAGLPFNPQNVRWGEWGAALVALAGPLTNFVIAFVVFGIRQVTAVPEGTIWYGVASIAILVNLGFFVFNMIPLPPLDGSRVLYALAPEFVRRGMEMIERYGVVVVFAVILLAGPSLGTFMSSVINFFLTAFSHVFLG
jgi:Zn-dependent protease